MNSELVTEKELLEARIAAHSGEMNVLKMPWWKELSKLTGAYDSVSVLRSFIDAMFYTLNGERDKVQEIPCLQGDYEKRVRIMQRAMILLGEAMETERFVDFIGAADQALRGKGSQDGTGAFYTPTSVCEAMSGTVADENIKAKFENGDVVSVYDPTIGAGRTLMSFCKQYSNYIDQIRACGTDIEINAVRMSYVNFALNGIAARVVHGNELSNDREWAVYYTPEWHIYEQDRKRKEQINRLCSLFASMRDAAAPAPDNSTTPQEDTPPADSEKMDVTIQKGGQLTFNF